MIFILRAPPGCYCSLLLLVATAVCSCWLLRVLQCGLESVAEHLLPLLTPLVVPLLPSCWLHLVLAVWHGVRGRAHPASAHAPAYCPAADQRPVRALPKTHHGHPHVSATAAMPRGCAQQQSNISCSPCMLQPPPVATPPSTNWFWC